MIQFLQDAYLLQGISADLDQRLGLLGELRLLAVVGDAVDQDQLDIAEELGAVVVLVVLDLLGHRLQVHGLLNDAVVVLDELLVDRLQERPRLRQRL